MVAKELTRDLAITTGSVVGLTAVGYGIGVLAPALAGTTPPHPALTGSLADVASILQNNVRVLAAPYLLWVLRLPESRLGRGAGDLLILGLTAANALPVGVELGRWGTRLLPYLPQLPLEWAALSVAVTAWLTARKRCAAPRQVAILASATMLLLVAAAGIETWGTPHRHESRVSLALSRPVRERSPLAWDGGCARHGACAAGGQIASRSQAPFPSQGSVPLGHPAGADRAHHNHRPPQGGN